MFIYLLSFSLVAFLLYAGYVFSRVSRDISLYRIVSKNAEARALLAKDPLRFHTSIVYLMASLLKTAPRDKQFDKLEFIGRYIREVCPKEIWDDVLSELETLTANTYCEKYGTEGGVVNKWAFIKGKDDWFFRLNKPYCYGHRFNSVEIAEEFGAILSEDDRTYLAYLLFRVANADGVITGRGKFSEKNLLHNLCVKGLKMEEAVFYNLLNEFATGRAEEWYNQHLKGEKYPAYDRLADIYQKYNGSFFVVENGIRTILCPFSLIVGFLFSFVLSSLSCCLEVNQMYRLVSKGVFLIPVLIFVCLSVIRVDWIGQSGRLLRTKKDDRSLQKDIVAEVLAAFGVVAFLYYGLTSFMLVAANIAFADEYKVVRHVNRVFQSQPKYYAVLDEKVTAEDFHLEGREKSPENSVDAFGLMVLRKISWHNLDKIENTIPVAKVEVSAQDYSELEGHFPVSHEAKIVLKFKVGYYGIAWYDTYQLLE